MSLLNLDWQAQALAGTALWVAAGLAARKALDDADRRRAARTADDRNRRVHS